MLTFLQKIRKSLIESGGARKYILYAVGEILLIMIGILLALQVNNWNEGRKEQKQMFNYVKAIYIDMLEEQESLDILNARFRHKSDVSVSILEILENPGETITDSVNTLNDLIMLGGNVGIDRKANTWDELKSTGKFLALEDKVLVEMLTDHYQVYDKYIGNYNRLPLDKLDELKEIASSLQTSRSIRELIIDSQFTSFSPSTFERFITHNELSSLISSIGVFSAIYNLFFIQVKEESQSILSYIEENYSDILHEK